MKILVTGGGGFLGSSICRQLVAAGHEPVAYQRSQAEHLKSIGVQIIRGDIRDRDAVHSAISQSEAVIHCAAYAALWGDAQKFHDINVTGTKNVLDACRSTGVGQVVYTSSPSVVLNGKNMRTFKNAPGSGGGRLRLKINRQSRKAAVSLAQEIRAKLTQ